MGNKKQQHHHAANKEEEEYAIIIDEYGRPLTDISQTFEKKSSFFKQKQKRQS